MKYTIDRIEGGYAVCEDENRSMSDVPVDELPEGVKAGDVLVKEGGKWSLDTGAAEERAKRIKKKMDALWE